MNMERIKAILVDDEWNSLQNLQQKLSEFCPEIQVLAITQKPDDGIKLIELHKPDVVFLDIEMPKMNGFRMLENVKEDSFEIIFTTAYNHYAVDAIRISAFDYLTKPIGISDLQNAVKRLSNNKKKFIAERIDMLKNNLENAIGPIDKIAISSTSGIEFFEISQIIRIESSGTYSIIHFTSGNPLTVTKLLKDFEDMLHSHNFFRVHHSHLINLTYLKKYIRGEGGQVIMQNGDSVGVSRRKKEDFLKLLMR